MHFGVASGALSAARGGHLRAIVHLICVIATPQTMYATSVMDRLQMHGGYQSDVRLHVHIVKPLNECVYLENLSNESFQMKCLHSCSQTASMQVGYLLS